MWFIKGDCDVLVYVRFKDQCENPSDSARNSRPHFCKGHPALSVHVWKQEQEEHERDGPAVRPCALFYGYILLQSSPMFIHWCTTVHHIPNGLVAMISACHSHRQAAGDQGSIPC
jgi:hypothetical protein